MPIGVGAAAAPVYIRNGEFADRVALAPPARKPIGGANCDGCAARRPHSSWDGSVQQGCPVCSAGTVVNACALARDGKRLLAGGYDRSLHARDLYSGQRAVMHHTHPRDDHLAIIADAITATPSPRISRRSAVTHVTRDKPPSVWQGKGGRGNEEHYTIAGSLSPDSWRPIFRSPFF